MSWLDRVRSSVTIGEILSFYGVQTFGQRAYCPIHNSDKQSSFAFTDEVFYCHQCGQKGSVLDLVAAIEKCDLYEAAAKIAVHYNINDVSELAEHKRLLERVERYQKISQSNFEEVNKALELYEIDECRGLSKETINHFGIKGTANGGYYIPLRDLAGNTVGWSIRNPEGVEPKYNNAKGINSRSLAYGLYENQGAIKALNRAIVVEGQLDACSVWDKGVRNVVAIMGSHMTIQQALTLMQYTQSVTLMFDGDAAGNEGMKEVKKMYNSLFNINIIELRENCDPADLTEQELLEYLSV